MEGVVVYIGDGVYAKFSSWQTILFTTDGITEKNHIYLEPLAMKTLFEEYTKYKETLQSEKTDDS